MGVGIRGRSTERAFVLLALTASCGRLGYDVGDEGLGGDDGGRVVRGDGDAAPGAIDAGGTVCAGMPAAGLRVHLGFDESATLVASDRSGNGNDGALLGMDASDWVPGRVGNALAFDGIDDRVDAGSDPSLDDVAPLTMCAWVLPRSYPDTYPAIADKSDDTFVGGWNFYLQDDASFGFLTNERNWVTGGTIELGRWHHLCAAWDGSDTFDGILLFQDGVRVTTGDSGSNGNQRDSDGRHALLIGRVNNGTFPLDGLIDEYVLYDRVLGDGEVAALHACGG